MYIPKVICYVDMKEMSIRATGMTIEMLDHSGQPYYKIAGDVFQCPQCSNSAFLPARQPIAEHYQPNYDQVRAHHQGRFA